MSASPRGPPRGPPPGRVCLIAARSSTWTTANQRPRTVGEGATPGRGVSSSPRGPPRGPPPLRRGPSARAPPQAGVFLHRHAGLHVVHRHYKAADRRRGRHPQAGVFLHLRVGLHVVHRHYCRGPSARAPPPGRGVSASPRGPPRGPPPLQGRGPSARAPAGRGVSASPRGPTWSTTTTSRGPSARAPPPGRGVSHPRGPPRGPPPLQGRGPSARAPPACGNVSASPRRPTWSTATKAADRRRGATAGRGVSSSPREPPRGPPPLQGRGPSARAPLSRGVLHRHASLIMAHPDQTGEHVYRHAVLHRPAAASRPRIVCEARITSTTGSWTTLAQTANIHVQQGSGIENNG